MQFGSFFAVLLWEVNSSLSLRRWPHLNDQPPSQYTVQHRLKFTAQATGAYCMCKCNIFSSSNMVNIILWKQQMKLSYDTHITWPTRPCIAFNYSEMHFTVWCSTKWPLAHITFAVYHRQKITLFIAKIITNVSQSYTELSQVKLSAHNRGTDTWKGGDISVF